MQRSCKIGKRNHSNKAIYLFIAINFTIQGKSIPLLYTIVLFPDIKNKDEFDIDVNTFEFYEKAAQAIGVDEESIEIIKSSISLENVLLSKIYLIQEYLGKDVKIANSLSIGLSEETLFTVQLLSELKSLSLDTEIHDGLFKSFLLNKRLKKKVEVKDFLPIRITALNQSQEQAVITCFKQPLTVIEGPPGL